MTPRLVKLQVNTTGAWRNVLDFDCRDEADVLMLAHQLFCYDEQAARVKLRIIMPGETAPLMDWTQALGWREWRA